MRAFFLIVLTGVLICSGGAQDGVDNEEVGAILQGHPIVDQRAYRDSENACGPAAILNFLQLGKESYQSAYEKILGKDDEVRIRFVIDRYFRNRPSTIHRDEPRWGIHGIKPEDLLAGVNELLAEHQIGPVRGGYLDREADETTEEMIERIHRLVERSLEHEVTPILSLRSFFVRNDENDVPRWNVGRHHTVVVLKVSPLISNMGFTAIVLDPWKGQTRRIFVHREGNAQPFRALKGNHLRGRWISGQPFLQVITPEMNTLRPRDLAWSDRVIVTANYLIGGF